MKLASTVYIFLLLLPLLLNAIHNKKKRVNSKQLKPFNE